MTAASSEWRRYPMLPIAAALGYAMSVIHIYGINPYIVPITEHFGWTRAQFTWGSTLAIAVQALFSVPIGMLLDRVGPRRIGLVGILLLGGAFALLGTASGDATNWLLLWGLIAFAALPVQATIWTSAVTSRFSASRGMALAVTLCGASVAQFAFPPLATKLIGTYGWQSAFMIHAGIWTAICLPIIWLFFRGAKDGVAKADQPPAEAGMSFVEGLRSSVYLRLLAASLFLTFSMVALVYHFTPMLTDAGIDKVQAGWTASLIGLTSIIGRLATGYLLDHYPAGRVGGMVYLLPVAGALVLLFGGISTDTSIAAAILVGLTLGAEIDVIVYLVTRHFGLKNFGALYGGLLAALSLGTAVGPLVAAEIFDSVGNYGPFLGLVAALMAASSLAMFSLPRPAFGTEQPA